MAGSSVGIALIGITLAALILRGKIEPTAITAKIKPLYDLSSNGTGDEIYDQVFVQGLRRVAVMD